MTIAESYTPDPALLSGQGISLTLFHPDPELTCSFLYRLALECSCIKGPLSYYISEHPGLGLLRLKSGALSFTVLPSERSVTLAEHGLYLFPGQSTCRIIVRSGAEYELLHFDGPGGAYFSRHLAQDTPLRRIPSALCRSGEFSPLFEQTDSHPVLCHMLLTQLLSGLTLESLVPGERIPPYLADLKSRLETHYYESFRLADLEREYQVSRYRLCREFKSCYQTSPLQYLHRVRIQAAKSLLVETNLKIHEISYETGYENVNHFIAHFKKITGMTPTEYRLDPLGRSS